MPLYFSSRFGADRVIDRFQEEDERAVVPHVDQG